MCIAVNIPCQCPMEQPISLRISSFFHPQIKKKKSFHKQQVKLEAIGTNFYPMISIAVIKYSDHKQFEEERVYFVYSSTSQFITEESQGRNSRRELGSRN